MDQTILHALDLAAAGDWERARKAIDELIRLQGERNDIRGALRHELGNLLTIAQANVEGVIDGVVTASPERLDAIAGALTAAAGLVTERALAPETSDGSKSIELAGLVIERVGEMRPVAAAKNVAFDCDDAALATSRASCANQDRDVLERTLTTAMLTALRYTPPGGAVRVIGWGTDSELLFALRKSVGTKLLNAFGSSARVVDEAGDDVTVGLTLAPETDAKQ